jgi:catechol 2,3-dioxygenase-like lactoylglutathione lyase family enzyme
MDFEYCYTRLNVANFPACLQFYQEILGFNLTYASGEDYAELETGATKITLLRRQMLKEVMGNTEAFLGEQSDRICISLRVRDLDEAIASLKARGIHFINKPWEFPDWGFISAFFRDPDGNLIELQQLLA